jgi:hypothetical protein
VKEFLHGVTAVRWIRKFSVISNIQNLPPQLRHLQADGVIHCNKYTGAMPIRGAAV